MKKYILIIMYAAISLQCSGQSQIQDKDFAKLVEKFPAEKFPINTKKAKKIFNVGSDKSNITKEEAIKFLNRTEESMYYFFELYDYDEDIVKGYEKLECIPGTVCKYYTKNFIALATIEGKINTDTTLIYLYTFNYEGKIIDTSVIGEKFTREDDWVGSIIEDARHFKVFWYSTNFDNYVERDGAYYVIDENQPQTVVEISDYQIDEYGKINLVKTYPKQYLKDEVIYYRTYRKNSDDPMNEYDF